MEIRIATEKDLDGILKIINFEIENSTSVYDEHPRSMNTIENWFEEKKQQNFPVFVAAENQQILGYATFGKFRPHDGYRHTVEHSIYISKDFRNQGIGRILMEKLIHSAQEMGFHTLIAGIDASNEKSCQFHEEFGFVEVGRLKETGFKFGKWLDLVFMQKML